MKKLNCEDNIERLIYYAIDCGLITSEDYFVAKNDLVALFGLESLDCQYFNKYCFCNDTITQILADLCDNAVAIGLCGDSAYEREQFSNKVMGLFTPRQSEISEKFRELTNISPTEATDYYFSLSKKTAYIKEGSSVEWRADTDFGELQLTINLSKPEKDPRKIAADRNVSTDSNYPKCLLCPQSAGFHGREGFPARHNHRIIALENLGAKGRNWYLQYSPYQYYNEHCIVLYEQHVPMKLNETTFETLFDFVDRFPHYFIGSNADLPIVGGSILSHEHYQGGRHTFPIEKAEKVAAFESADFGGVSASTIRWPLSTIRLTGRDRVALASAAMHILDSWKDYDDDVAGVISHTLEGGTATRHNTVTPILRKNADGFYELDVVLRNNFTDEKKPLGRFHPHEDVWHIKKENIGLIEVMGLAVLPARLVSETAEIVKLLTGEQRGATENIAAHSDWVSSLIEKYGASSCTESRAREILNHEIGLKFSRVLYDCGVFKQDETGISRFVRFMKSIGFNQSN